MSAPDGSELLPQNSNGDMRLTFGDDSLELRTEVKAQKYTVRGQLEDTLRPMCIDAFPKAWG